MIDYDDEHEHAHGNWCGALETFGRMRGAVGRPATATHRTNADSSRAADGLPGVEKD